MPTHAVEFQVLDALVAPKLPASDEGQKPRWNTNVQLFGVTADGAHVCAILSNYSPRCYIRAPEPDALAPNAARVLQDYLSQCGTPVGSVRVVLKTPLIDFHAGRQLPFFEIEAGTRRKLEDAAEHLASRPPTAIPGVCKKGARFPAPCEIGIDQTLRQFHRNGSAPCTWVTIPNAVPLAHDDIARVSVCDIEIHTSWTAVKPLPDRVDNAPFVLLSYDIETFSADGSFPDPTRTKDRVVAIGSAWQRFGSDQPPAKRVDVLLPDVKDFELPDGTLVRCWPNEAQLLLGWNHWAAADLQADLRMGYNTWQFDDVYMHKRAELLGVLGDFQRSSKLKFHQCKLEERNSESKQRGARNLHYATIPGVVNLDVLQLVVRTPAPGIYLPPQAPNTCPLSRPTPAASTPTSSLPSATPAARPPPPLPTSETTPSAAASSPPGAPASSPSTPSDQMTDYQLESYKLKDVAVHFAIGEEKIDLPYQEMFRLVALNTKDAMATVADYCAQDALLPLVLVNRLQKVSQYVEMSRVCLVTLNMLFTRGQQIKVSFIHTRLNIFPRAPVAVVHHQKVVIRPLRTLRAVPHTAIHCNSALISIHHSGGAHRILHHHPVPVPQQRVRSLALLTRQPVERGVVLDRAIKRAPHRAAHRPEMRRRHARRIDQEHTYRHHQLAQHRTATASEAEKFSSRLRPRQVFSQIAKRALDEGYVLPPKDQLPSYPTDGQGYQGAFVLDADRGVHPAVAINDFSSLYPSICIGWNLCYTTFVPEGVDVGDTPVFTVDIDGTPHRFVTKEVHKGLLPSIMEHLLSYRKATKKEMKKYAKTDPMYAILDGRQNALKVSANSVYGFCGASVCHNSHSLFILYSAHQHFQLHRPDTMDRYALSPDTKAVAPAYTRMPLLLKLLRRSRSLFDIFAKTSLAKTFCSMSGEISRIRESRPIRMLPIMPM